MRQFINDEKQTISYGASMDTVLTNMQPEDFKEEHNYFETMNSTQLNRHIDNQRKRGVGELEEFMIEKYKRIASCYRFDSSSVHH